jgi:hypothetical protein
MGQAVSKGDHSVHQQTVFLLSDWNKESHMQLWAYNAHENPKTESLADGMQCERVKQWWASQTHPQMYADEYDTSSCSRHGV